MTQLQEAHLVPRSWFLNSFLHQREKWDSRPGAGKVQGQSEMSYNVRKKEVSKDVWKHMKIADVKVLSLHKFGMIWV